MGGANKAGGSVGGVSGAQKMPEIRPATLPTAADWRNELAFQQRDLTKGQNNQFMADLITKAANDVGSQFSRIGTVPAQPMAQWKSVQGYSSTPGSNTLQFTPLTPPQVFNDQRNIVNEALAYGVADLAGGALKGLSLKMASRPRGSNMNYQG